MIMRQQGGRRRRRHHIGGRKHKHHMMGKMGMHEKMALLRSMRKGKSLTAPFGGAHGRRFIRRSRKTFNML